MYCQNSKGTTTTRQMCWKLWGSWTMWKEWKASGDISNRCRCFQSRYQIGRYVRVTVQTFLFYLGGSISKRIWPRRLPWLRQHSHSGSNHPPSQLIGFSFTFACTTSKCPKISLLFKIAANRNYKAFWCWKQIFAIPTGRTSWKENGHSHSEDRIYQALEYTWHI